MHQSSWCTVLWKNMAEPLWFYDLCAARGPTCVWARRLARRWTGGGHAQPGADPWPPYFVATGHISSPEHLYPYREPVEEPRGSHTHAETHKHTWACRGVRSLDMDYICTNTHMHQHGHTRAQTHMCDGGSQTVVSGGAENIICSKIKHLPAFYLNFTGLNTQSNAAKINLKVIPQ